MTAKRNPVRPILWVATGIAFILAVGFVWVAIVTPLAVGQIATITVTQSKAVPNFDGGPFEVTDKATLAEFRELLLDNHVVPPFYLGADLGGCTGGTSSDLDITYVDGRTASLQFYDCGDDSSFPARATRLLSDD